MRPTIVFTYKQVIMEDDYSALVKRILQDKTLSHHVKNLMQTEASIYSNPPTLNLITENWSTNLTQNPHFQNFQFDPAHKHDPNNLYGYETSTTSIFHVLIAGYCRFSKPYAGQKKPMQSVILSNCAPLSQIARMMIRDLGDNLLISDEFKFSFVPTCTLSSCVFCKDSAKKMKAFADYFPITKSQTCVTRTKIFDGKEVVNRFQNYIIDIFPNTCIAVLHLTIDRRYHYTDKHTKEKFHRIGGIINVATFCQEEIFNSTRSVHLGDLSDIELYSQMSTLPEEKNPKQKKSEDIDPQDKSYSKMYKSCVDYTAITMDDMDACHSTLDGNQTPEEEMNALDEQDDTSLLCEEDLFAAEGDTFELKTVPDSEDFFSIESESKVKRPRCEESFLSID